MMFLRSHLAAVKPVRPGSTMVASCGIGTHQRGAVAAHKTPLASQLICLHVPGRSAPEVGMAISVHHGHPMEELAPPYKGQLLKGHQEDRSGMVWGTGAHRCQWQGDVMQPVVAGMHRGHHSQRPQGFGMGGQEKLSPGPDHFHPCQSCPCCHHHRRALARHTHIGVYVFLFKPLQM